MTGGLAKRYARALAAVAAETGRLEETAAELERAGKWLQDPELATALVSPILGTRALGALISEITRSLELSELAGNFLGLLAQKGRLGEFRNILRAYVGMVDQAAGRVRATVRSAQPLSDASLRDIALGLEELSGKRVVAQTEIDDSLIAGLTVEMDGRVYDGSVRTHLAHLARAMAREGAAD
jgi:F-type H+-transporting ATPase subunit delta